MGYKVGLCITDEDGNILKLRRQYFRQGYIFKDEDAYKNRKNAPCYVPEMSDTVYTGKDFLRMCNGQQDFADELFGAVDWQHPETLLDEWLRDGEWACCSRCGTLVDCGDGCNDKKCPNCGKEIGTKGRIGKEDEKCQKD